jgi:transposase InsO family protein
VKKRQHTPEQIIRKLAEGEKLLGEGRSIGEVARHLEITESTWHRWRNQYDGMKADDAKELRELRKENQRLAQAVADWCRLRGTGTVFIDPGSPWQNAWIESFNGRMRDEVLNGTQFDSRFEARVLTEAWRIDYNNHRPHSAHGWLTPVKVVQRWVRRQQLQLA